MFNIKSLKYEVKQFINFKKAISGGEKDLTGYEDDVCQEVAARLEQGETREHALENGFNAHYRFVKSKGMVYVPEFFDEQVKGKFKPFVKMTAKDIRFVSYKNFWRSFCDHPHSFETICQILEDHCVKFEVVPSNHEKFKVSISVDVDCPVCGKRGCYQICLKSDGWYFGKCKILSKSPKPGNVSHALAIALSKPYQGIKEYIYEYLKDSHGNFH